MVQTDISTYNNDWYKPGPGWKIILWMIVSAIFFRHGLAVFTGFKCWLIRCFGGKVGKAVMIKPGVTIKYPWLLSIGNYTWIGENVWIDNLAQVTIGSNVCVSQGAMLLTGNHDFTSSSFDLIVKEIVLEDGVWIGAKSVVCPGIRAFSHSMLTVQSVATRDLEQFIIYTGIPAKPVRSRILRDVKD